VTVNVVSVLYLCAGNGSLYYKPADWVCEATRRPGRCRGCWEGSVPRKYH